MTGETRNRALRRASGRFLRRRGGAPLAWEDAAAPWDAGFFALAGVQRFRDASEAERAAALGECARRLMAESWQIEKCGIDFCARMVLVAESLEEKRLFALIGADEATHSTWLDPWVAAEDRVPDPFNRFIAGLAGSGKPQPLAFLLQVVLEGFGIVHYAQMAAACREPALAAILKRMAQDEALHHAAGIEIFAAAGLGDAERRFIAEGAYAFLQMIRIGPQAVAAALDRAVGLGGQADRARVFAELDCEAHSAAKLQRLRRLMAQPGMHWLIDELQAKGAFVPCRPAECARAYADTL